MLDKLLRLGEGRMVKRLKGVAEYVNTLAADVEKLSDAEPVSYTHLTLPTNREV